MATSSAASVKTRFLLISDTHHGHMGSSKLARGGNSVSENRSDADFYSTTGAFRPPLPKADVLLHSGDLSMIGSLDQYEASIAFLASVDAEAKLVIAGNHDLSLHERYYRTSATARELAALHPTRVWDPEDAARAHEMWTGPRARAAGITFLDEGLHRFELRSGARFTVYASPWQPEFCDWAFNYPHAEDRWNPPHLVFEGATPAPPERDPHPIAEGAQVDIVMTHGPARSHLDTTAGGLSVGCPHLLRALERVRPRLHCCGHIHEAWGAERVAWDAEGGPRPTPAVEVLARLESDVEGAVRPGDRRVVDERAAFLDFSAASARPLRFGHETIMVNASVLDLGYQPSNASFVVELDLPRG